MNNQLDSKSASNDKLKIALFGFGCVGQGFYEIFNKHNIENAEIGYICVKQDGKERPLPDGQFVFDKAVVLNDPEVNLIVELISDADDAFEIVSNGLRRGLKVISANKKMIAEHLYELIELQQLHNGLLLYEASCCGSIPIIRTLEDAFAFEEIKKVSGIFNGSSNYILSKVNQEGISYEKALEQAQDLGFAEADPTLDVGGFDALNKLCIITLHAFGVAIQPQHILNLGIHNLKPADNLFAAGKQWKLKQVAFSQLSGADKLLAWVMPQFIEDDEELYVIENEFNAVILETAYTGTQLLKGKGAGAYPTGAAVFSDFKAVTSEEYCYRYPKIKTAYAALNNESIIKIYCRASKEEDLKALNFKVIREKGKIEHCHYLIGEINLDALRKAKAHLEKSKIFIAALPEREQDFGKEATLKVTAVV